MEEVNISTLGVASGSCFTDNSRGTFKDLFAEKLSLRVVFHSRGKQHWCCYCGLGSYYGMPECLSKCAVAPIMPSLLANTLGYHFSFLSLLDCYCHNKSRRLGFGREEAIIPRGCSALQTNTEFGCGPQELQHF